MPGGKTGTMKLSRTVSLISFTIGLTLFVTLLVFYFQREKKHALNSQRSEMEKGLGDLMKEAKEIENSIVQNLPIYSDFANPKKEGELRRYLLAYHLREGEASGIGPVERESDLDGYVEAGKLVKVVPGGSANFYFYNVPDKFRLLTPRTRQGLEILTERIQKNLHAAGGKGEVKIALSSAMRPAKYQDHLRGINSNASNESSHSYGVSFDVFYDDYFAVLKEPAEGLLQKKRSDLRRQLGFLMGDALARQYHGILMKTLLDLQEEGLLYAIQEKRQRVYHVTIRGEYFK